MVVSGLPKKNMGRHSGEICTIALNILMNMEKFIIHHMPNETLLVRIGVHTGKRHLVAKNEMHCDVSHY